MPQELLLQIPPEVAVDALLLKEHVSKLIRTSPKEIQHISIVKRSIDARQKAIKINLKVMIFMNGETFTPQKIELPEYQNVTNAQEVIVIGAGPAGLFAALQLIEIGLKPIVIERWKRGCVAERRDLKRRSTSITLSMKIRIIVLAKAARERIPTANFTRVPKSEATSQEFWNCSWLSELRKIF